MKQKIFICVGILSAYAQAMEHAPINTYNRFEITSRSIIGLSALLPQVARIQIQDWADKETALLHSLSKECTEVTTERTKIKQEHAEGLALLNKAGYKCSSKYNYIFKLPVKGEYGEEYVLRMSGPNSRAINLLHSSENNKGWNMEALTDDLKRCQTHQTVSQLAHYLRCREYLESAKSNFDTDTIQIPPTYGVQIPDRSSMIENATDENCVVVQEFLPDFAPVRDNKALLEQINPETLEKLIGLIKYAGLWDIEANLLGHKQKPVLGMVDFEQPNNENPENFFHRNPDKYENNVCCGLKETIELFRTDEVHVEQHLKTIKRILLEDAEIQQWSRAKEVNAALDFIQ